MNYPFTFYKVLLYTIVLLVISCRTTEVIAPIQMADPVTASQASLVSIQAMDATSAEVVVKSIRLEDLDWQITARSADGIAVALTPGATKELPDFNLTTLRLNGLVVGQTYQVQVAFRFGGQDSLTTVRTYTHRLDTTPRWTRLAHASFSGGDYTACPVAVDEICGANLLNGCGNPGTGAYVGNRVQLLRYPGPNRTFMDTKRYDRATDSWPYYPTADPIAPRHNVMQFNLFFHGVDRYRLTGLGFIAEERAASKYFYYRTMRVVIPDGRDQAVNPSYEGEDGELLFFTTTDEAYFLTQNGSPAMRSIHALFDQTVRAPPARNARHHGCIFHPATLAMW